MSYSNLLGLGKTFSVGWVGCRGYVVGWSRRLCGGWEMLGIRLNSGQLELELCLSLAKIGPVAILWIRVSSFLKLSLFFRDLFVIYTFLKVVRPRVSKIHILKLWQFWGVSTPLPPFWIFFGFWVLQYLSCKLV